MRIPRIAIAQVRPRKANYEENLRRIGAALGQVASWTRVPDVLVFPETVTSGYFLEGGVRDVAIPAEELFGRLVAIHKKLKAEPIDIVVGFYELHDNQYYNAALYGSLGDEAVLRHVHRKVFLPTYGVFDEQRFVQPATEIRAFNTAWGRAAIVICEDAWHSLVPTIAALNGAQVLFVPSASPARGVVPARVIGTSADEENIPASLERWERLARTIAAEHGIYVALAQLVGFEGGKGFPGGSLITAPDGDLVARGPLFEEAIVYADCDLTAVTRARTDAPMLADLEDKLPHLLRDLAEVDQAPRADLPPVPVTAGEGASGDVSPAEHSVHGARQREDPLAIDPELVTRWLLAFIREEVVIRRGFEKVVVGLSGGVDSSVTATLAARALGPENVVGVRMPYVASSSDSLDDAKLLAERLGITLETVEITQAVNGYAAAVKSKPDPPRLGNVMARIRMTTLFDLSVVHRALPLGTGNKSERLLGYFTWHADDSPPVNPIGDLFKTEVWALARYLGVPDEIVEKPATADLIRGQTDEVDLGISYPKADHILYWLLNGVAPEGIVARGYTKDEVETVRRRLESTHWKRRMPTVAMVSQTAIGEYYLRPVDY
jgi:NAD+ synthase (glutamine-hydrolysing)